MHSASGAEDNEGECSSRPRVYRQDQNEREPTPPVDEPGCSSTRAAAKGMQPLPQPAACVVAAGTHATRLRGPSLPRTEAIDGECCPNERRRRIASRTSESYRYASNRP